MTRFQELQAKMDRQIVDMRVFMASVGMKAEDIDAAINRLFEHVTNGGKVDPETMRSVFMEYMPSPEDMLEHFGFGG